MWLSFWFQNQTRVQKIIYWSENQRVKENYREHEFENRVET